MSILKMADVPAATVETTATVLDAIELMVRKRVGAVVVAHNNRLAGVFSERDVMVRVVLAKRDAATTRVSEVMTTTVETAPEDMTAGEALSTMLEHHIRHLPIVEADGRLAGMISIRNLLQNRVEDLSRELDSLENYLTADGPGG